MTEKISLDGSFNIKIPIVGEMSTSFEYECSEGNEDDAEEEFEMEIALPILNGRVLALPEALKEISNVGAVLAKQGKNSQAAQIGEALKKVSKYVSRANVDSSSALMASEQKKLIGQKDYASIKAYLIKIPKTINGQYNEPIPGNEDIIIKNKDKWVLKNIKISKTYKKSIGFACSAQRKHVIILGDNTLSYIKDRYNVYGQSRQGDIKENPLWQNFKNAHIKEIKKMFKNMSRMESNIIYELQDMYNKIIELNPNNHELKNKLSNSVFNFIIKCKSFKENHGEKDFISALELLEEILGIQFKYSFVKEQNMLFSINN